MDIQTQQLQSRIVCATLGNTDAYLSKWAQDHGAAEQDVQQSEVQRQTTKLLETAETLDAVASTLIARIEGITRPEPKSDAKTAEGSLSAAPATSLGRSLDSINHRIRNTMASLQSTIQRIEL